MGLDFTCRVTEHAKTHVHTCVRSGGQAAGLFEDRSLTSVLET